MRSITTCSCCSEPHYFQLGYSATQVDQRHKDSGPRHSRLVVQGRRMCSLHGSCMHDALEPDGDAAPLCPWLLQPECSVLSDHFHFCFMLPETTLSEYMYASHICLDSPFLLAVAAKQTNATVRTAQQKVQGCLVPGLISVVALLQLMSLGHSASE